LVGVGAAARPVSSAKPARSLNAAQGAQFVQHLAGANSQLAMVFGTAGAGRVDPRQVIGEGLRQIARDRGDAASAVYFVSGAGCSFA
jgi:hypothetical protein